MDFPVLFMPSFAHTVLCACNTAPPLWLLILQHSIQLWFPPGAFPISYTHLFRWLSQGSWFTCFCPTLRRTIWEQSWHRMKAWTWGAKFYVLIQHIGIVHDEHSSRASWIIQKANEGRVSACFPVGHRKITSASRNPEAATTWKSKKDITKLI